MHSAFSKQEDKMSSERVNAILTNYSLTVTPCISNRYIYHLWKEELDLTPHMTEAMGLEFKEPRASIQQSVPTAHLT